MVRRGAAFAEDAPVAAGGHHALRTLPSRSACGSTLCEHEAMNRNPAGSTSGAASRASLR